MTVDDLLMGEWRDPSERELLVEKLIETQRRLDAARVLLRDLGAAEGDTSLANMVSIWMDRALKNQARVDELGTRVALAERLLRPLLDGHGPVPGEWIQDWRDSITEEAS